jgi:hypothetical protein
MPTTMPSEVDLKATAQYYHKELGIAVVPWLITQKPDGSYDKKPLIPWGKWQTEPQTDAELEALNWSHANGIGIVLGTLSKKGFYLVVIDYDVKGNASEEAKAAGAAILKGLPPTWIEVTVNKGLHYFYWSSKKPRTDSCFHDTAGVELLGNRKCCVVTPSFGYRNIGSDIVADVEDIEKTFYEALKKQGFTNKNEAGQDQQEHNDKFSFPISKIVDLSKLSKEGDDYYGCHPKHGSTTGKNFHVNMKKNAWACLRCGSGGGPLQLLAVKEGIIKCEQATKKALTRKKFIETVKIAINEGLLDKAVLQKEEHETDAKKLLEIVLAQDTELFIDQYKKPFIRYKEEVPNQLLDDTLTIDDTQPFFNCLTNDDNISQREKEVEKLVKQPLLSSNLQVSSRNYRFINRPISTKVEGFNAWTSLLFWKAEGKAIGSEARSSATSILIGLASEGKKYKLFNRVAPAENGGIWLDMTDNSGRAIKVAATGWEVVNNPPIIFRRSLHQQPILMPAKMSLTEARQNINLVFKYLNLKNDDDKLMYICYIVSCLYPEIPHPIPIISGPQGSAKSWFLRITRRLIDPSINELLTVAKDEDTTALQLYQNYCAYYDNISYFPTWLSDLMCKAVTGAAITKRKLYTDDEEIIWQFLRCLAINGINIPAKNGDLFQRSIPFEMAVIPDDERKLEAQIIADFDNDKSVILGAILTLLAEAIRILPKINVVSPRMADFNRCGCAIAEALGKTKEDFQKVYKRKMDLQTEETINADPVASAFYDFCQYHFSKIQAVGKTPVKNWNGKPSQLFKEFMEFVYSEGIKTDKFFPTAPNAFMRRINRAKISLLELGYEVVTERDETAQRKVSIRKNKQTQLPLISINQELVQSKIIVPNVPSVPNSENITLFDSKIEAKKPIWFVKDIPPAEKCECGTLEVTKELLTPTKDTIKRCTRCYDKLKRNFPNAIWKPAFSDMPDYEEAA